MDQNQRGRMVNRSTAEKNMIIAAFITAVSLFGDAMLYAVLPVNSEEFGLTALWQVGALLSINRFVRIPIHPLIGWFYTRYPVRNGLFIAICLTIVSTFAYGYFYEFIALLIARCVWGVAWAFIKQAGQLLVVEAVTESKQPGKLTGLFNGIAGAGVVIGMVVGSLLSERFDTSSVLTGFAIISVLTFPLLLPIKTSSRGGLQHVENNKNSRALMLMVKDRRFIVLLLTGFVISLLFQGYVKSTLSYWIEMRDFSALSLLSSISAATLTGIILTLKLAADPFLGFWVGRFSDIRQSRTEWLTGSIMVVSILFVIIAFHLHTVLWLSTLIVLFLVSSIVTTLLDADAAQYAADSSNKHYVVSSYSMTVDIGAALGPFLGFTLLSVIGDTFLNVGAALLLVMCALVLLQVKKRDRKNEILIDVDNHT
ncbi:MFS transporter [Paenibacillus lactis]